MIANEVDATRSHPGWKVRRNILRDAGVINAVSGAAAGALTATFVCPLDVLKTRLQLQRVAKGGIADGLAKIVQQQGFKGLYQGLGPTLMALLPNWAVYFTIYDRMKNTLTQQPCGRKAQATPLVHMTAAASAGATTLLVTNPLWVVKTRMQTQHMQLDMPIMQARAVYTGTLDALRRVAMEEGFRGLYSGLLPSLMGIMHVAIQFPLYEHCKTVVSEHKARLLREARQREAEVLAAAAAAAGGPLAVGEVGPGAGSPPPLADQDLTAAELVVTSALSKLVASTVTYPHEVVRSYMHVSGRGPMEGLKEACRTVWKEDGVRGFYRGCATNLLRTTPAAALTFTSFELIARTLRQLGGD